MLWVSAGLAACSADDGGAVVARWRLIDAPTGVLETGCRDSDPAERINVTVDHVRLRVLPADPALPEPACPTCTAPCGELEATTAFEIPEGRYLFRLEALACGATVGDSPPPVERTVVRGEITNLSVIGISIAPMTISGDCNAGPDIRLRTDASVADAAR